jgi:16S rRNA (uracil1498-N3)-methyltransferase
VSKNAPRLFVDAEFVEHEPLILDAEQSHYLCRVLRLRANADVVVFNGDGSAWAAHIEDANSRRCRLMVDARQFAEPAPVCRLHLAQALLKGERQDYVLQKATELGATDIWLLRTERTEARVRADRMTSRLRHWQRVLQSACEQCGRLRPPELHANATLDGLWPDFRDTSCYILQPGAPILTAPENPVDTALIIGPEGGFSERELRDAAAHGAISSGLGPRVLRADTAPQAALTIIRHGWGWGAP